MTIERMSDAPSVTRPPSSSRNRRASPPTRNEPEDDVNSLTSSDDGDAGDPDTRSPMRRMLEADHAGI